MSCVTDSSHCPPHVTIWTRLRTCVCMFMCSYVHVDMCSYEHVFVLSYGHVFVCSYVHVESDPESSEQSETSTCVDFTSLRTENISLSYVSTRAAEIMLNCKNYKLNPLTGWVA